MERFSFGWNSGGFVLGIGGEIGDRIGQKFALRD